MYPERMSCKYWSNKAVAAREASAEKPAKKGSKPVDKTNMDVKVEA